MRWRVLAVAAAGLAGVLVAPPLVSAAPPPIPPSQVHAIAAAKTELAALETKVEVAVEDYDASRVALATASRRRAEADGRVARAEVAVTRAMGVLADFLAAAYRTAGHADPIVALINAKNTQSFLDQGAQLDHVARSEADAMRSVREARRVLTDQLASARQLLAAQHAVERHLAAVRRSIEASVARQKQLLDVLETKEARRQRLLAERRAAEAARRARLAAEAQARAAAARAARVAAAAAVRASRRARRTVLTYSGPVAGRAAIAVAEAYRQLGKAYQWGASGPDTFDCSGLTMWAWGKAGVSLPHYSGAQFNVGTHVSQSELRPGDLVFFGHPIHHIGIYIGNGQMIHAPHTGDVVKISCAFRGDYVGAVRL
jgi:cell wall-associated NlpC family hydrolase